jgi:TRAP-type mannitol/chloroaromatic compound transport system permease large subunit
MGNDVLISIPLFVFMGYLVERANLIEKLFKSLHLAMARVPGSLAVATLFTCAVFATATGIVGAVVTLMGLLALPQMLRGGYDVRVSAGAITAGGCLGILIPPSVMLIVYGATAGVSVVQLYAGAFFPGIMLAGLYVVYVIVLAKLKPHLMPPLSAADRFVPLPPMTEPIAKAWSNTALPALLRALKGGRNLDVPTGYILKQLGIALLPALLFLAAAGLSWHANTAPPDADERCRHGAHRASAEQRRGRRWPAGPAGWRKDSQGRFRRAGRNRPPRRTAVKEPPADTGGLKRAPWRPTTSGRSRRPARQACRSRRRRRRCAGASWRRRAAARRAERQPATRGFWIGTGIGALALLGFYALLSFQRLEIFKMLLASFFPLLVLILAVLGSIVMGLATPTEAAAVGAFGGFLLALAYRQFNLTC